MILEAFDLSIKMQTKPFHIEPNTVPGPQPMLGANEEKKMSVIGEFPLPRHGSDGGWGCTPNTCNNAGPVGSTQSMSLND